MKAKRIYEVKFLFPAAFYKYLIYLLFSLRALCPPWSAIAFSPAIVLTTADGDGDCGKINLR
jgi:uncharacterized membrane protein